MLNKLLKRCMPWMDKGRWYHVRIESDSYTDVSRVIFDKPMFSHYTFSSEDGVHIYFSDTNIAASIIDYKGLVKITDPEVGAYITTRESDLGIGVLKDDNGYYLKFYPIIGVYDVWFYIQTY